MKTKDYIMWVNKEGFRLFNELVKQEVDKLMNDPIPLTIEKIYEILNPVFKQKIMRKTTINSKTVFDKVEDYKYKLPCYTVMFGEGIKLIEEVNTDLKEGLGDVELPSDHIYIPMLRGSKIQDQNKVDCLDGVLIEQLVAVALDHLQTINTGELATRESAIAITKLEEALLWLAKRTVDREANGTLGTYNK